MFRAAGCALAFTAPVAIESTGTGVTGEFELGEGESRTFVLETAHEATPLGEPEAEELMRETAVFWREGSGSPATTAAGARSCTARRWP